MSSTNSITNLSISKAAFEFWTGFNDYTDNEKAEALCYWAGKKAYLDMNRTLTFNKEKEKSLDKSIEEHRKELRDNAIKTMYNAFKNIEEDFDPWHKNLCKEIIDIYKGWLINKRTGGGQDMTIGQAQKWINMTIKYIWLVYSVSSDNLGYYEELMNEYIKFHIPLDSIILKYIDKNKIIEGNLIENYAWSKIDDYEKYANYQSKLKNKIKCVPLEWELVNWVKAVNENKKPRDSKVYTK